MATDICCVLTTADRAARMFMRRRPDPPRRLYRTRKPAMPPDDVSRLPAADEVHDLDHVVGLKQRGRVLGAGDDLAIALDGDGAAREAEELDEGAHREAVGDVVGFAVDREPHRLPSVPELTDRANPTYARCSP